MGGDGEATTGTRTRYASGAMAGGGSVGLQLGRGAGMGTRHGGCRRGMCKRTQHSNTCPEDTGHYMVYCGACHASGGSSLGLRMARRATCCGRALRPCSSAASQERLQV